MVLPLQTHCAPLELNDLQMGRENRRADLQDEQGRGLDARGDSFFGYKHKARLPKQTGFAEELRL